MSSVHRDFVLHCAEMASTSDMNLLVIELPSVSYLPSHLSCITALESKLLQLSDKDKKESEVGRSFVVVDVPSNTASAALISFTVCMHSYADAQNGLYKTVAVKRLTVRVGEEVNECLLNYVLSVCSCDCLTR